MTTAPVSHVEESLKLEVDGYVDLYEVRLKTVPTIYRFHNGATRTWNGVTWEHIPCQLSGEAMSSEDQKNRPTLTVANPDNIFGAFAAAGYFDLCEVIRKRVLQQHFYSDAVIFEQRVWICGRPGTVNSKVLQLELRSPLDMPAWRTPRRTYSPPEFPFITI